MHLKMSSGKWRSFCLDLNVLILLRCNSTWTPQQYISTGCLVTDTVVAVYIDYDKWSKRLYISDMTIHQGWLHKITNFIFTDVQFPRKEHLKRDVLFFNFWTEKPLWRYLVFHNNMVRWISAPGAMHFRPRYDTFWPRGLFTLLQFCKHPPSNVSLKLRWISSVSEVKLLGYFPCFENFELRKTTKMTTISMPADQSKFISGGPVSLISRVW